MPPSVTRKIPVIACIDVEPDEREIDSAVAKDWQGFEALARVLMALRKQLEHATGAPARFSWFLRIDPQIEHTYGLSWWVFKRYRDLLAEFESAGDEIGLHVHAWRWNTNAGRWVIDHQDREWIAHCVRMSLDGYQAAFGRPCRSFRFGDHWMNNETMNALEDLGIKFDLTIEPGVKEMPGMVRGELHKGSLPDYRNTLTRPYQPSRADYKKESRERRGHGLWMIPLSTGQRHIRFTLVERIAWALGFAQARPLNFALKRARFAEFMKGALDRDGELYLAPVVRTDAGVKPVAMSRLEQNMAFVLSHPLVKRFQFATPAEAIELLA